MHSFFMRSLAIILAMWFASSPPIEAAELIADVNDSASGKAIAARVYVRGADGKWLFVESAHPNGSALPYREQWVPMPNSVERHTTVSAHPFRLEAPAGDYVVTIERGKEYFPLMQQITLTAEKPQRATFSMRRWIDMAKRGWYSGETHVHRRIAELPNAQLAEDLNVAFPVTFWTIEAYRPPGLEPSPLRRQGPSPFGPRRDRGARMISIDDTHVMFPRNTEYEIFSIEGKRHVLGAMFILNHRSVFREGMPPVRKIAEQAHREGALLDLDKHNWPWSMMLVPIAKIDLYELSNNSVWRTEFGFRGTSTEPGDYMRLEREGQLFTEWGWLQFGFENYYALLNCGFRLQPTAGTASGVHPVPLGHSRVYVRQPDGFSAASWLSGLKKGRSFVTTGPMLFCRLNEKDPGEVFRQPANKSTQYRVECEAVSARPLDRIEVLVNGEVVRTLGPRGEITPEGARAVRWSTELTIDETSWIALRCWQWDRERRRVRFAHTAPWWIEAGDKPIRPRREEIDFLLRRVRDEIRRNKGVISAAAMSEYQEALKIYEEIARRAR